MLLAEDLQKMMCHFEVAVSDMSFDINDPLVKWTQVIHMRNASESVMFALLSGNLTFALNISNEVTLQCSG